MEKARIVVFEDSERLQELIRLAAQTTNHEIIAGAQTLPESLKVIDEEEFDVAVVDGNLSGDSMDCSDGKQLVAELRAKKNGAKVIWFSSFPAATAGVEPDHDTGKDIFAIFDVIENS